MVAWERQEPVKSNKSNQSHNESSPLAERQPSLPGKKKTEFGTFWNYFMATWPGCQQVNRILAAFGCGSLKIQNWVAMVLGPQLQKLDQVGSMVRAQR